MQQRVRIAAPHGALDPLAAAAAGCLPDQGEREHRPVGSDMLPTPAASRPRALLAQLVEHFHGKEGVNGSSPLEGFPAPIRIPTEVGARWIDDFRGDVARLPSFRIPRIAAMITDHSKRSRPDGSDEAGGRGNWVLRLMRRWPVASALVLTAVTMGLLILGAVLGDRALQDRRHVAALEACPPTRRIGAGCVRVQQGSVVGVSELGGLYSTRYRVKVDVAGRESSAEIAWGAQPQLSPGQPILLGLDFGHIIIMSARSGDPPYYETTDHPIYAQESDELTALLFAGLGVMFGMLAVYAWARKTPSSTEPRRLLMARIVVMTFVIAAILSFGAWRVTGKPPNHDLLIGVALAVACMAPAAWRLRRRDATNGRLA